MNQRVKDLSAEARKLTPDELAELVNELLVALHETDPGWDKAWAEEAERRMAAYRRGEMESYSLDEVLADLENAKPAR